MQNLWQTVADHPQDALAGAAVLALLVYLALLWGVGGWPGRVADRRRHPHRDAVRVAGYLSGLLWPPLASTGALSGLARSWLVGPLAGAALGTLAALVLWMATFTWAHAGEDRRGRHLAP